jgi:hypothetical protein
LLGNTPSLDLIQQSLRIIPNKEEKNMRIPKDLDFFLSKLSLFGVEDTCSNFLIVTQPLISSLVFDINLTGKHRDTKEEFIRKGKKKIQKKI